MHMALKRAYDPAAKEDGFRVLVDRLWPRGLAKAKAEIDLWEKAVAPSTELRKWFSHDPEKWPEFRRRYQAELRGNPAVRDLRRTLAGHPAVTLVYAARDTEHNDAVVLRDYLLHRR